jgi:hypothetical protein
LNATIKIARSEIAVASTVIFMLNNASEKPFAVFPLSQIIC